MREDRRRKAEREKDSVRKGERVNEKGGGKKGE